MTTEPLPVSIIGYDDAKQREVTCLECTAILSYIPLAVKEGFEQCMGERDVYYYIECPGCQSRVRVKR